MSGCGGYVMEERMQWKGRRQSTNVEDRRGMGGGRVALGAASAR